MWEIRESGLGATAFVPGEPDAWSGWEDSAVDPRQLGRYLREFRSLLDKYGYRCSLYGHFGQGCVHTRIDFELTSNAGIQKYRAFVEEAADLAVSHRGSFSGEHGDGQSRGELLPKMFGKELVGAFAEFKQIWDPRGRMNPGKVVEPYAITENLRLGAGFRHPEVETYFKFPQDEGNFGRATMRCVGVGKCRREGGGTMCPSYMVTKEELHTTRGRAHALFEMLHGGATHGGFRDEHVKSALDLCLACKGCKNDCPVNVDVATYKAEFLAHYYRGRLRPRPAYAMGLIMFWARLAGLAPRAANVVSQAPFLSRAVKALGGINPERQLPRFAPRTFKDWFFARAPRVVDGPEVVLWPDTFNNFFEPETAIAATWVLEDAGYKVVVPKEGVCCGRPLYDYGMLSLARRFLLRSLRVLRSELAVGTPIVGLEPSCVAVFRDELPSMLPDNPDARRMAEHTRTLSEFLVGEARERFEPKRLEMRALVHGHCQHKAIMKLEADEELLGRLLTDHELLDSGCCGMAGSFGYEEDKYGVSMACGERVLLPSVREAKDTEVIVADGFSCRSQIKDATEREALHTAEVIYLARQFGPSGPTGRPEAASSLRRMLMQPWRAHRGLWLLGLGAGLVALWYARRRFWAARRSLPLLSR